LELFEEMYRENINQAQGIETVEKTERSRRIYEKLIIEKTNKQELSSISQYFIALFVLVDSNGILDIPDTNEFVHNEIVEEIAPHFDKTSKVISGDQAVIRLKNLQEKSKNQFLDLMNHQQLNPIVNDLYSTNKIKAWEGNFISKEYKVNLEAVEKQTGEDILLLWNFFNQTFVRTNGHAVFLPNGWEFNDSFKDRIAVQAFASVCNSMTVIVNCEKNLIASILIN